MLEHELDQFGLRLGLPSLSLDRDGKLCLNIGDIGSLHLEKDPYNTNSPLIMYLSSPVQDFGGKISFEILKSFHWKNKPLFPVAGGIYKDNAVLLVRLEEKKATAAIMENVLRFLMKQMGHLKRSAA